MPQTFSFEEATAPTPNTFSFEEATQEPKRIDLSKPLPFNAYVDAQMRAANAGQTLYNPLSGGYQPGNPLQHPQDTSLLEETVRNPVEAAKELALLPFNALTGAGKLAYATAADVVSKGFGDPQYGGNLAALSHGEEEIPAERFIGEAAKTNPKLALTAKLGEAATEMAPALGLAGLPAGVNRALAAGFSADMIAKSPALFKEYAEEINKPEDQQDPAKINALKAAVIQNFTFAPLAGAGALHDIPLTRGEKIAQVTRELSKDLNAGPQLGGEGPINAGAPVTPGLRQLGVRVPGPDVMEEPGLRLLASQALKETQPGALITEQPAIERLRNLRQLREQEIPGPTTLVENRPGGSPALGGRVSFAGTPEAKAIPSARQSALLDTIQSTASLPQPPGIVETVNSIVNNKDRLSLEEMKSEIEKTGVGVGTRSMANDSLRIINQRLEELKTDKPHPENEALRRVLAGRPAQRGPAPSVEAAPPAEKPAGLISGSRLEAWADDVLKGGAAHVGTDVLSAFTIKGAAIIERGIRDFAEWSSEMVKRYGDAIKPHLQKIWSASNDYITKGVPDALHTKATQAVRDVRSQPGEIAGEVPVTRNVEAVGERGGQKGPVANVSKEVNPALQPYPDVESFSKAVQESPRAPSTEQAQAAGMQVKSVADLDRIMAEHRSLKTQKEAIMKESKEATTPEAKMKAVNKGMQIAARMQLPREALEAATNTASGKEGVGRNALGERPMDWRNVPEAREWLIKNAKELWGENSEAYKLFQDELAATPEAPKVEGVKALEPESGSPLSATDSLINRLETPSQRASVSGSMEKLIARLESLKVTNDPGQLFSVPHPDAIKTIGRSVWNTAVDLAIQAVKAGKSAADAINEAITHIKRNASGFNEGQIRANLDHVLREEAPVGNRAGAAPGRVAPSGRATSASLDDVYERFTPEVKEGKTVAQRAKDAVEAIRTGFSSRFRPLDKLAEDIAKAYGGGVKRLAGIFEQLKGASGKAEADVYRFDQDVTRLVGDDAKDFNAYMFLRRSLDRLQQDEAGVAAGEKARRKVSDYTIPEIQAKLSTLMKKLSPEQQANFERAAELYQQHMDQALRMQVDSGRMSQEVYDAIKSGNQFYAPFKILKYLEEQTRPEGTGRKIDTTADYTKAMEGIEDPNFKLGDMLAAGRQNLVLSRILAEKNRAMVRFAEVADADKDGLFVQKVGPQETAPAGKQIVNVFRNGDQQRLAVDPSIADAVQLFNPRSNEALANFLRYASMPFRAGATIANLSFQAVNLLLADAPRAALISKYGIRGATDLIRYPLDMAHAFLSAMEGNLLRKENKLYLDYLDSGAAGAVIQDYLTPDLLKFRGPNESSLPVRMAKSVVATVPQFAKAIEETSKILGIKRAMRFEGVESGKDLAKNVPEAVTEVRRFSGSPDFGRQGKWVESARLNLLFMFLNARIQGAVADVGRFAGRDGAKPAAAAWARAGVAIGTPTAALWYLNNLPQYKKDYDLRPKNEKDNYWLIPKDNFITDDQGNKVRDYWRIPKREIGQIMANMVESSLNFAKERDPEALWSFGVDAMENLSPLNIRGENMQERMESMLSSLNPAIKAPLEMGTGRDTFRHRDIVPDQMQKASPEQQYLDRTPQIYRKLAEIMPDVAPDALRSPLMLENLVQNFTANLIQQFLPSRGVKGRDGLAANPLMRRFVSVPYTEDPAEKQQIQTLQRESADDFLKKDRAARELYPNAQTPQDLAKAVASKYGTADNADKIFERALDLWIADRNGVTRQDRALLALPTQERAKYVLDKIKTLDPQSKVDLLIDYEKKRILTDGVIDSMIEQGASQK